MSYRDEQPTPEAKAGQAIYMNALEGRHGFRPDQMGIPAGDAEWTEIFEAIGNAARGVAHILADY